MNQSTDSLNEPLAASPSPKIEASLLTCRILVVDDRRDNRHLMRILLTKMGATVELAEDGEAAIAAVAQADTSKQPFDCILMDMHMPGLDGYEATRLLREQGVTTPILALTASATISDRERCLKVGCDEYISKPIDHAELLRLLQNLSQMSPPAPAKPR